MKDIRSIKQKDSKSKIYILEAEDFKRSTLLSNWKNQSQN
jgi:hypothetical protein